MPTCFRSQPALYASLPVQLHATVYCTIHRQVCVLHGHHAGPQHDKSMMLAGAAQFLLLLGAAAYACSAEEVVVDFEKAVPLLADQKANRVPRWEEKGVVFTLAREPQQTKG